MLRACLRKIYNSIFPIQVENGGYIIQSKVGKNFLLQSLGDNKISIGKNCMLSNTSIFISGDNNQLIVEDEVRFMGPCRIVMNGNSILHIKRNAGIRGVEFNLNGANIEVGELCMFSYGITLRNHDSHKIIDPKTQQILNPPKDIVLGSHVWVAQNATILKGCRIGSDSVIGFGSIVTKSCAPGSIMTGIPAKVVKENIIWDY